MLSSKSCPPDWTPNQNNWTTKLTVCFGSTVKVIWSYLEARRPRYMEPEQCYRCLSVWCTRLLLPNSRYAIAVSFDHDGTMLCVRWGHRFVCYLEGIQTTQYYCYHHHLPDLIPRCMVSAWQVFFFHYPSSSRCTLHFYSWRVFFNIFHITYV